MKTKKLLGLLCALILLAGLSLKLYTDRYVLSSGLSLPRDASYVDLRQKDLTMEQYLKLQASLPDCLIHWYIPFQGQKQDSRIQSIQITSLTMEDADILALFPELTLVDASECTDYETLLAFSRARPDCQVSYQIPLGKNACDSLTVEADITDPDIELLQNGLGYLPNLKKLHLRGDLPAGDALQALAAQFPQIEIRWSVELEGRQLSSKLTQLDISDIPMTDAQVRQLLQWLPNTRQADLRGCGLSDREMMALADENPDIFFLWEMTFGNVLLPTDAEELDISNQLMQSTSEIEDLLPYFPNVKKVVMSHCGFDDETMDALNKRYDDIRFVWSIQVQNVSIRTDTTFFYPFKYNRDMTVNNDDLYPLRYCTDIVAVDIGHMWAVTDCEWAAFMPKLKYLILVETQITDLSPLANCKELCFLEIFKTQIRDYSPLVNCTSLVDINMCRTYGDYRPLLEMPWLQTVYWNGIAGTVGYPCSGAEHVLPEALPNTRFVFFGFNNSYYNGWRDLQNYKDMRDVMGMFYLR